MAVSGPQLTALLTAPYIAMQRPMPYAAVIPLCPSRSLSGASSVITAAAGAGAATAPVASIRRNGPGGWLCVTHGSLNAGAMSRVPHPWHPAVPGRPNLWSTAVCARYLRSGQSGLGVSGGEVPPPVMPPDLEANGGSEPQDGGFTAAESGPVPQSNAVPFITSTRQRHHHKHSAAAQGNGAAAMVSSASPESQEVGGSTAGIGAREEAEAYVGPDEDIRHRAQALRQAMFLKAEQRAIGLHPDILVEDLVKEAAVPYDDAGSLDLHTAHGSEGEAAGDPSAGAGAHAGLAVESVYLETGGFTVSRPVVDPAYDDVGRAIREEHDLRGRRPHGSLLAVEARARKAATAEDLHEAILDSVPELQSLPQTHSDLVGRSTVGGLVKASDENVESLLEELPFGQEGAVFIEGGDLPAEEASALVDPLSSTQASRGGSSGADQLDAALNALEHRAVLELLESGAVSAATASTDITSIDVSNVMPSPLPEVLTAKPFGSSSSGRSNSSSRSHSRSGPGECIGARARKGSVRPIAATGGGRAQRRMKLPSAAPSSGTHHNTENLTSSYPPPLYRTSPDVPDEDLVRRQRWAFRSRREKTQMTDAIAACIHGNNEDATVASVHAVPQQFTEERWDKEGKASVADTGPGSSARWLHQAPLYNTSPDVRDEDLEQTVARAAPLPDTDAARAADNGIGAVEQGKGLQHSLGSLQQHEERGLGGRAAEDAQPGPSRPPASGVVGLAATAEATARQALDPPLVPPPRADGDNRRLRSLCDVDRQFIDLDTVSGWDEQAHDLRTVMRGTVPKLGCAKQPLEVTQPPGARGASSSLQPQTIGIHGATAAGSGFASGSDPGEGGEGAGRDGRSRQPLTVLRVECVPSQTYGVARTAAVLAADGKLTLLARPTGPSPERVRAAIKLLHMAPGSRDFETSAAEAAAVAADDDERAATIVTEAVVAAARAAVNAVEMEAQVRPASPGPSVDERDLQPGLILGQSEIDPAEVQAEPNFPLDASLWMGHHNPDDPHDPHNPHVAPAMEVEGHMLGPQANMWHEDYDEVMGQIYDGQRSGWCEDGVNSVFDSDVY